MGSATASPRTFRDDEDKRKRVKASVDERGKLHGLVELHPNDVHCRKFSEKPYAHGK